MKTKPIVLDLRDSPYMGGINNGLFRTASEFSSRDDIEVVNAVLADKQSGWVFDRAKAERLVLEWIPCYGPLDFGMLRRLKKFINEKNIDLIVTRDYRGNLYTQALLDLGWINIPNVAVKHGVSSFNHWRIHLYHYLNRRPLRRATRVIAVDIATYDMLLRWGVSKSRLRLIPNPAPIFISPPEVELDALRDKLNLQAGIPIILYLGRIEQNKGLLELLYAHQQLSKLGRVIYTVFVGDGSYRHSLMEQAATVAGAERVIFPGAQLNVSPFLAISDIVTLPSYREGMPNSLLEAMAAAKPVVATTVGGIPSLVADEENGLLIPPRDSEALCSAFIRLLDNMDEAKQMGERGYQRASDEFSMTRIVNLSVTVYQEALAEKKEGKVI